MTRSILNFLASRALHALSLVLLLSLQPVAMAQPASLAPDLSRGRTWTYDFALDLLVGQSGSDTRIVQSARVKLVAGDSDEGGLVAVHASFQKLVMVWNDSEGQSEFVWDAAEDPTAEKTTSQDAAFAGVCKALARSTITLSVTAAGEVAAVEGFDAAMESLGDQTRYNESALGLFSPFQAARTFSPIWRADAHLSEPRAVGQTWKTASTIPMGSAGSLVFTTEWRLSSDDNSLIRCVGAESVEVRQPPSPDPAAPSMALGNAEGSVQLVWDAAKKSLQERKADRRMTSTWRLGDLTLDQNQVSKSAVVLVAVAGP